MSKASRIRSGNNMIFNRVQRYAIFNNVPNIWNGISREVVKNIKMRGTIDITHFRLWKRPSQRNNQLSTHPFRITWII